MSVDLKIPVALRWNQLALDATAASHTPFPIAARALAMLHTAMFNAWSVYDSKAISTHTAAYVKKKSDRTATDNNKQKALSHAAFHVLTELFTLSLPAQKKTVFRDMMLSLNYDPADTSLDIAKAQGIGNLAAKMVIEYHAGDGANADGTLCSPRWSDYTGFNDTHKSAPENFMTAHWGLVKSFALGYNARFRPPPPYKHNQPQFKEQVREILQASAKLTDEQKATAEYWSGDLRESLVCHWFEIAQFVAKDNSYENDDCIKLLFALANALFDASIACWDCLRFYDAETPIGIIRALYGNKEITTWAGPNKGTRTIKGEDWRPFIGTPPVPGYVSPYSTASRAAAVILQRYIGSDRFRGYTVIERGSSQIEKGLTPGRDISLEWGTFTEAAKEAGRAGLYGGIYFARADIEGQQLGQSVGLCVWEKTLLYFND